MLVRTAVVLACLGTALAVVALPAPASAHAQLVGSDPADGSVVEALPDAVVLSYNEDIAPQYVDAAVVPPGGDPVTAETSATGGDVTVELAAAAPAGPGAWQVVVRVVSVDGHPVESTVEFEVTRGPADSATEPARPDATSPPEPGTGAGAASGAVGPEAARTAEPEDAGADSATASAGIGTSSAVTLAGLAAAAVAVAVAAGLLVARRRRPSPGPGDAGEPGPPGGDSDTRP